MNLFTIFYEPVPWQRSRHHGKKHYDAQRNIKDQFIYMINPQLPKDFVPYDNNIELRLDFHMPIPKSYSKKKKKEVEGEFHSKKPDLSNLIKFIEDTFNKILWTDDSKIVYIFASKKYSTEPKILIYINERE